MSSITYSWSGVSGDWNTPNIWNGSAVPAFGGVVSIIGDGTVTIGAGETAYADGVTLDGGHFLGNPGPTLAVAAGGTLDVAGTVALGGGEIDLGGVMLGTLVPIAPAPGFPFPLPKPGTIDVLGGTIVGAIDIPSTTQLIVDGNGLDLVSPGGGIGQIAIHGNLEFDGTQTVDNVTIDLSGSMTGDAWLTANNWSASSAIDLTLGQHVTVTAAAAFINGVDNKGLIEVIDPTARNRVGDSLYSTMINEGTLTAAAGAKVELFSSQGTAINAPGGTIAVGNGGSILLDGTVQLNAGTLIVGSGAHATFLAAAATTGPGLATGFGTVVNNGGSVLLDGTLLNAGQTLVLSALTTQFGTVALESEIVGGTVVNDDPGVTLTGVPNAQATQAVALKDVNWKGDLSFSSGDVGLDGYDAFSGIGGGQGTIALLTSDAVLAVTGTLAGAEVVFASATGTSVVVGAGTLAASTTLVSTSAGARIQVNNAQSFQNSVNFTNQGLIDAAAPGGVFTIFGTFTNQGTVRVENGDSLSVEALGTGSGGVFDIAAAGTLELRPSAIKPVSTIAFADGSADTLRLDLQFAAPTSPTIAGFQTGNDIDMVLNIAPSGHTFAAHYTASAIGVTMDGAALVTLPVVQGQTYADSQFVFTPGAGTDIVLSLACFAAGTGIATPAGTAPVETIHAGDMVCLADGSDQRVTWVGHRTVDIRRHPRPETVRPVRIQAGAFGPGQPACDLWLSPDHAVFIGGVLIPIRLLVNGTSICPDLAFSSIQYWHVELDEHGILLADGLPVESYLDTGQRNSFTNHGGLVRLHAVFAGLPSAAAIWEARGVAPLVQTGPSLAVARAHIARQRPDKLSRVVALGR